MSKIDWVDEGDLVGVIRFTPDMVWKDDWEIELDRALGWLREDLIKTRMKRAKENAERQRAATG